MTRSSIRMRKRSNNARRPGGVESSMIAMIVPITMLLLLSSLHNVQAQEIGVSICACTPSVYTFAFNFSNTCEGTTIDPNTPGILDFDCLVSPLQENEEITDFVPIAISTAQVFELNRNFQVVQGTQYNDGPYGDGATITYTSIAGTQAGVDGLTPQTIPSALQLSIVGINAAEEFIVNTWIIVFDNECGTFDILTDGDHIGWTTLVGLDEPLDSVCPSSTTPTPTTVTRPPTPKLTPAPIPINFTLPGTDAPTMSPNTTAPTMAPTGNGTMAPTPEIKGAIPIPTPPTNIKGAVPLPEPCSGSSKSGGSSYQGSTRGSKSSGSRLGIKGESDDLCEESLPSNKKMPSHSATHKSASLKSKKSSKSDTSKGTAVKKEYPSKSKQGSKLSAPAKKGSPTASGKGSSQDIPKTPSSADDEDDYDDDTETISSVDDDTTATNETVSDTDDDDDDNDSSSSGSTSSNNNGRQNMMMMKNVNNNIVRDIPDIKGAVPTSNRYMKYVPSSSSATEHQQPQRGTTANSVKNYRDDISNNKGGGQQLGSSSTKTLRAAPSPPGYKSQLNKDNDLTHLHVSHNK